MRRRGENPEDIAIRQALLRDMYKKAQDTARGQAIDPIDFASLYGEAQVRQDKAAAARREEEFREAQSPEEAEARQLAFILEQVIINQAELSEWLGPNAAMIRTSWFDDIMNGVDAVAEFQEGRRSASHLALAIDVVMGGDAIAHVRGKFQKIRDEIREGELATVKYFQSERVGFRGELSGIPRVVVGASGGTARELGELWVGGEGGALGRHPVQFQILEEMLLQAKAFQRYAAETGQEKIAARYAHVKDLLERIYEEKKAAVADSGRRDSMFTAIRGLAEGGDIRGGAYTTG